MFRPVKVVPLSRIGSPLSFMVRRALVTAVAMAFLATVAVHADSETLGASLLLSGLSLRPGTPWGSRLGVGAGEASSGRQMRSSGRGDISGQEASAPALDVNVTVNYANQIAIGSPRIFGGTHCPRPDHTDAWDEEAEVGVTMLRQDWFLNDLLPNSTVEGYKSNINNIQDPSTWPFGNVQWIADHFTSAQSRGIELMAIVDYAPHWLTYSGTQHGVPKDWWVWEDIVKKAYLHFRNQYGIEFDYIEVWNEPSAQFLDVTNSGMTRAEAYKAIYYHTWKAIREVDPRIPIGGPADYAPYETEVLEAMLQDSNINDKIDFVSYHYYDDTAGWKVGDGPPERFIDHVLQAYGREDMPVMLSEYNGSCCGIGRVNSTDESISYIGDKFVWFLKRGFVAANYFSLTAYCGVQGECYYDWIDGQAQLKPQAKTWRLASKKLGLGDGPSKVMETTHSNSISAVGAINASDQYVVLIANDQGGAKIVTVTLENLRMGGQVEVEVYLAYSANDATQPVIRDIRTVQNGSLSLVIDMPAWSVVGIKLSPYGQPTPPPTPTPTATPTPIPTDNLLDNGSFEEGERIPAPWKGTGLTLSDGRLCNTAHDGSCSFRTVGAFRFIPLGATTTGKYRKFLRQVVNISGNAGDGFTLSGWSRAENPSPLGRGYCLQATVFHTDGTKKRYRTCFAKRAHGWQYRQRSFTTVKPYNKIVVSLRYKRQSGEAWFDDVRLIAD